MTRVVADTNVFISGLLFGGLPKSFFDLAFRGGVQLVTSDFLLDELERKLLGKFRMSEPRGRQARLGVVRYSAIVTPQTRLAVVGTIRTTTVFWSAPLLAKWSSS